MGFCTVLILNEFVTYKSLTKVPKQQIRAELFAPLTQTGRAVARFITLARVGGKFLIHKRHVSIMKRRPSP